MNVGSNAWHRARRKMHNREGESLIDSELMYSRAQRACERLQVARQKREQRALRLRAAEGQLTTEGL